MKKMIPTLFLSGMAVMAACPSFADSPANAGREHSQKMSPSMKSMKKKHSSHSTADCHSRSLYGEAMQQMHREMNIAYTGDADVDFAKGMAPHHYGAVLMAETELKFGTDPVIRKLAEWIIRVQTQEIGEMRHWLYVRGYLPSIDASTTGGASSPEAMKMPSTQEYMRAMEVMHKDMMSAPVTGNADIDFITGMIPHHQGAIDMARVQLRHGRNAGLTEISHGIIRSQAQEIRLMQERLAVLKSGKK